MFSCTECGHTTHRRHDLQRHMRKHAKTSFNPNLSPKIARCEPNLINPPTHDHFLVDQNSQRGFGMTPTDVANEV